MTKLVPNILITGASSGLGAHFARVLAASGANVAIAARRVDRLQAAAEALRAQGSKVAAVAMDVTDEASVCAGFDAAERTLGPISGIVANAGVGHGGMAVDLSVNAFDDIMAVNVRGVFLTAREGARRMMARGEPDGRIVLVASIGGLRALPGLAAYSASKAAVVMLGQSLAREWINHRINVNVLCPGYIKTELNDEWFDSPGGRKQVERFPRKRLMEPGDLDGVLLQLLAADTRAITGSVFKLDDGQIL